MNNPLKKQKEKKKKKNLGKGLFLLLFCLVLAVLCGMQWNCEVIITGLPGKPSLSLVFFFFFFFNSGKCDEKSSAYLSMVSESAKCQQWAAEVSAPSY